MSHHHGHSPENYNSVFAFASLLNFLFIIVEVIYALMANSMSLLADAVHNMGDVVGLLLAWGANWLLSRAAHTRYSYGYKKTTVIAALLNALLLVATSSLIAYESIAKLIQPEAIQEWPVIIVALIGTLINGGTAMLFLKGSKHDLNIKGAFVHLAADALISIGVVIAGIVILYTGWLWVDPVAGLLIVLAILFSTWELLMDSVNMILDATPRGLDQDAVREFLSSRPGVHSVHDLHIWSLSTREIALTAHLIMPEGTLNDEQHSQINLELEHRFKINHVTLQVEEGSAQDPCGQTVSC